MKGESVFFEPQKHGHWYIIGLGTIIIVTNFLFQGYGIATTETQSSNVLIQLAGLITTLVSIAIALVTITESHVLQNYSHRASSYFFKSSLVQKYAAINGLVIFLLVFASFFAIELKMWEIAAVMLGLSISLTTTIRFIQKSIEFTRPEKFQEYVFTEFNQALKSKDFQQVKSSYHQMRDFCIRSAKMYDTVSTKESISLIFKMFESMYEEKCWVTQDKDCQKWLEEVFPSVFFEIYDITERENFVDANWATFLQIRKLSSIGKVFEQHTNSLMLVWNFWSKKIRDAIENKDENKIKQWIIGFSILLDKTTLKSAELLFHDMSRFLVTNGISWVSKTKDAEARKIVTGWIVNEYIQMGEIHKEKSSKIASEYLSTLMIFHKLDLDDQNKDEIEKEVDYAYRAIIQNKKIEEFTYGIENIRGTTISNFEKFGNEAVILLEQILYDEEEKNETKKKIACSELFIYGLRTKSNRAASKFMTCAPRIFKNDEDFITFTQSTTLYARFDPDEIRKTLKEWSLQKNQKKSSTTKKD